jgi:MerR family transcriptional regulator, copper efflux regulator
MSQHRLPLLQDLHASQPPRVLQASQRELGAVFDLQIGNPVAAPGLLQVGDLARHAGKTVRTLHLYEELELLVPAARSRGGFRLYAPEALVRIRWISKLQDIGLSLAQIQAIARGLDTAAPAPHAMAELRAVYHAKLAETRTTIRKLQALEAELDASLEYLATCQSECESTEVVESACGSCEVHDTRTSSCDAHHAGNGTTPATTLARAPRAAKAAQRAQLDTQDLPAMSPANTDADLPDLIRGIRTSSPHGTAARAAAKTATTGQAANRRSRSAPPRHT